MHKHNPRYLHRNTHNPTTSTHYSSSNNSSKIQHRQRRIHQIEPLVSVSKPSLIKISKTPKSTKKIDFRPHISHNSQQYYSSATQHTPKLDKTPKTAKSTNFYFNKKQKSTAKNSKVNDDSSLQIKSFIIFLDRILLRRQTLWNGSEQNFQIEVINGSRAQSVDLHQMPKDSELKISTVRHHSKKLIRL